MTGIIYQAMFMPVRLHVSFNTVSNSRFALAGPVKVCNPASIVGHRPDG